MQFTIIAFLAAIGTAAAAKNALVRSFDGIYCNSTELTNSYVPEGGHIGCATTFQPNTNTGSTRVVMSGCQTYFFTDKECKSNYFGAKGKAVPDSNCWAQVGSYSVVC